MPDGGSVDEAVGGTEGGTEGETESVRLACEQFSSAMRTLRDHDAETVLRTYMDPVELASLRRMVHPRETPLMWMVVTACVALVVGVLTASLIPSSFKCRVRCAS